VQAKGRIPEWAEPMIKDDKAVEWMRRQHWKNNKNKGHLASSPGEITAGMVANDGLGAVAPSVGEAVARDGDGNGAGASDYWTNVLQ
jgi:hypothetical protein